MLQIGITTVHYVCGKKQILFHVPRLKFKFVISECTHDNLPVPIRLPDPLLSV